MTMQKTKKLLAGALAAVLLVGAGMWLGMNRPWRIRAADCTVTVKDQPLNTRDLPQRPAAIYADGELLVWAAPVARQLGYTVQQREDGALLLEDSIQQVALRPGDNTAVFTGKLKIIDLSREELLPAPTERYRGEVYVSPAVFEGFFNVLTQGENSLDISPVVYELLD